MLLTPGCGWGLFGWLTEWLGGVGGGGIGASLMLVDGM